MSFLDRLRPRWRHSDPDVRADVVRTMTDLARLGAIASKDADARVRRLATKRLDDPGLLDRLAQQDADALVRDAATERAREVRVNVANGAGPVADCEAALARLDDERSLAAVATTASHATVARAALDRVANDRVLREVVQHATSAEIRGAALDRIHDPAALRAIALGEGPADLALRALDRIDDAAVLHAIAANKAASKAVRKRAQERLPAGPADGPAVDVKRARVRLLELGTEMRALDMMPDVIAAGTRARAAEQEWQALARVVEPKADVAERFTTTCRRLIEAADRLQRHRVEAEQTKGALDSGLAARRALCEQIEALDGPDVLAAIAEARAAWARLAALTGASASELERRFRAACEARRTRYETTRAEEAERTELAAVVDAVEQLVESGDARSINRWPALEKRWTSSRLVTQGDRELTSLQTRFARARERLRQRLDEVAQERVESEHANLRHLTELVARVEGLATAETLRLGPARAELRTMDAALADLGPLPAAERRPAWRERLTEARTQLRRRVTQEEEVEGWRRWANVDAQEAIITRAEALHDADDLAEVMPQLKQLQDEWAQCATVSPDKAQALWERFRTARNHLQARVDAYLSNNLEQKRALCAQVADLGESTAWNETAAIIKQAQGEWKIIGPVPPRATQELWQRFRDPCDRFFARRKAHFERMDHDRRGNAERKTALCDKAEALRESTDWDASTTIFKDLQAEWKRSGPAPREEADALWERFRTACDYFFDRRSRRDELERDAALDQARLLCDQLEALATSLAETEPPAAEHTKEQLDEAWGAWIRLDLMTVAAAADVHQRLRDLCVRIAAAQPEGVRGSRLDPAGTLKRRQRLCERLEALTAPPTEAPRPFSLQEQALALREQLASNTIAGAAGSQEGGQAGARQEVDRIRASWALLGPPLDDAAHELEARVARAQVGA